VALYACTQFALDGVTCEAWATVNPYLLPPLSVTEAGEIAALIIGCWIIAVCGRYLLARLGRS
jgi:hypothetical protein